MKTNHQLGAQDPPGTFRLPCGCVSHLCEQHQGGVTNAAIPPNTYRGFNGETCELKTSTGQTPAQANAEQVRKEFYDREYAASSMRDVKAAPPVQGAGTPRFDEWFKTYLPGVSIPLRCDEHMRAAWDAAPAAHQSPVEALREALELIKLTGSIRDRKIATRALAAQKKPPQMSVRYCGHEAPIGKACPVCFPAQTIRCEMCGEDAGLQNGEACQNGIACPQRGASQEKRTIPSPASLSQRKRIAAMKGEKLPADSAKGSPAQPSEGGEK